MLQYIEEIFIPFVDETRNLIGNLDAAALVVIDNFKGQFTESVNALLEMINGHICLLPPNTTDRLQPMDISVNKCLFTK